MKKVFFCKVEIFWKIMILGPTIHQLIVDTFLSGFAEH